MSFTPALPILFAAALGAAPGKNLGLFYDRLALADGQPARTIYRTAAVAFAKGQGVPPRTALGAFAYGD